MSSPRGRNGYTRQLTVEEAGGGIDPDHQDFSGGMLGPALAGVGIPAGALAGASGGIASVTQGLSAGLNAGMSGVVSALDYKVLVLNKAFVAVRVISARRAFSLLCREIAEIIHVENGRYAHYDMASWAELSQLQRAFEPDKHDWVKTVRVDIAVPRIIRLLGYDRLPAQIVKLSRRNLFARDRNTCQYCGKHFATSELSIDHVNPRAYGGGDSWENLVCSCIKCNARKGGRTPDEAQMKLIKKPARPKRNPLITIRLGQDRYSSWKAFLDDAYWNVELG